MKKLRRVTEAEVIAEFLRNEFYHEEFHRDRAQFERLVLEADVTNDQANMLRRALLYRRRGHMWRELPQDTQWWEIQLDPEDMANVRVFPRAHWRRIANGSYRIGDVVKRIRTQKFGGTVGEFISKIHLLNFRLRFDRETTSVILIALDEGQPMTIIEGNHRMTAAMLGSPNAYTRFRFFFGSSPCMNQVCWHYQSVPNLARYISTRLKHLWDDPEANIAQLIAGHDDVPISENAYAKAVAAPKVMPETK